jgi:hypothetical protein
MARWGITRAQAAAIPHATLGYRIDGGKEHLLVLARDDNGQLIWTAASHVVLTMRQGRIVRTVGLRQDLGTMTPRYEAALPPLLDALKAAAHSTRLADLPAIGVYSMTLECTAISRGPQPIRIIGTRIAAVRVDESCASTNPKWSITDQYWLDPRTRVVWKCLVHPHPGRTLEFEILRQPG